VVTTPSDPSRSRPCPFAHCYHVIRFPIMPLLLLLFAGSGCAALIYEIVWYQMLQLAIGSTSVSMGILVATYMGGLCIGSIWLPRTRWAQQHPLRVYGYLEAGIAAFGLLVLFGLPLVNRVYVAGVESGMPGMLLRGLIAAVCMLVPTILMGASLPAIVRWVKVRKSNQSEVSSQETDSNNTTWWGLLYAANTVGAVAGCLFAGFYLLRVYDVTVGTLAAAAINLVVAAVSLAVAARSADIPPQAPATKIRETGGPSRWPIYVTIALSGACALGGEIVWTRLLGYLFGVTVYGFAIILAVFLIGLAIGSGLGSAVQRNVNPRAALGWAQLLAAAGIAWTAYMITDSLPFWPIDVMLYQSPWHTFQLDFVRAMWGILPATLFWGASFPLACAAASGHVTQASEDSGSTVGKVYAANTLGAIVGALGVSLALVPWIGTQQTQRVLLVVSALSALFVLVPMITRSLAVGASVVIALMIAGWFAVNIHPTPPKLIAYGRQLPRFGDASNIVYTVEGRNSSVAIGKWPNGSTEIDVNGHIEATSEPFDMKLQRMVGHLPGLLHPNPKSILGIGFGAGVSAGSFTRYPTIEHITVCEIEPVIPPTSTRFFGLQNYEVYKNPKTRVVFDDARHYLMTTKDKFDIIASDPLDVFAKGTAALYTKEYFDAVKRHLNPGGYFTLYVPLYETDMPTIKSELATFFEAFPYGTIWANTRDGRGYDMVFMGQAEPLQINVDEILARGARADYAPVIESLHDIGVGGVESLLSTFAGQSADFAEWLKGSAINRDRDLKLQYMAGWGINSNLQDTIYREIMKRRKSPAKLLKGSQAAVKSLTDLMFYAGSGFAQ
jgi:spermidine synthase